MRRAESLAALEELICMCRRGNVHDHLVLIATHSAQHLLRKPLRSGAGYLWSHQGQSLAFYTQEVSLKISISNAFICYYNDCAFTFSLSFTAGTVINWLK